MNADSTRVFPNLSESFKRRFPFRLSVPSFIYPAGYADNVRMLASFVDEIELLLLESGDDRLPSESEIEELAALGTANDLTYNIHLPTDLDLSAPNRADRRWALERLCNAIERAHPLAPTTYTLHLPYHETDHQKPTIGRWAMRNAESLTDLLTMSRLSPRQISIETLDYPPDWFESLVNQIDLAVCIDMGHVLRFGHDLEKTWGIYGDRTTMVHLHGVCGGRDHLGLDQMPKMAIKTVRNYLNSYTGALSLEVFSFDRLNASLPCLAQMFPLLTL